MLGSYLTHLLLNPLKMHVCLNIYIKLVCAFLFKCFTWHHFNGGRGFLSIHLCYKDERFLARIHSYNVLYCVRDVPWHTGVGITNKDPMTGVASVVRTFLGVPKSYRCLS